MDTLLALAIRADNPRGVFTALAHGADPNGLYRCADDDAYDADGYHMLHGAARRAGSECVQLLLTARADPTTRDGFCHRPLETALRTGRRSVIPLLMHATPVDLQRLALFWFGVRFDFVHRSDMLQPFVDFGRDHEARWAGNLTKLRTLALELARRTVAELVREVCPL